MCSRQSYSRRNQRRHRSRRNPFNPLNPNNLSRRFGRIDMQLEEFAARLRRSGDIVFFTGAGISTESGVPDFRSPGGIWTKYQPVYFQDFVTSETARIHHWQLKKATYELYKKVQPNIGHYSIRDF